MNLNSRALEIDAVSVEKRIARFLQARLSQSGRKGLVVGLSGGLDSSTTAALCARAIPSDGILGLIMPHRESDPLDKEHALTLVSKLKIPHKVIDITAAVDAVEANIGYFRVKDTSESDGTALKNIIGNIKARIRMVNLYMAANSSDRLVVGSGDKSEFLVGYFTKYGDGGADIFPIADLYKTQVRALAHHLGVPDVIVSKASTPGLWKGQSAEAEIGFTYEQLDLILYALERFKGPEEIADSLNINVEIVNKVESMIKKAEHKRRGGTVLKIGYRTPTLDWRTPL